LSLQHPDGWWKGELESNATMIAEHLSLHHFLGLRDAETDRLLANELLARQRADGTWSIWFEGPADLSVTVEAYTALKLAGVDAGEAARQYIRHSGGVARTRIFTRAFLALIGQWPWRRLAHVPVELILLPATVRFPSTTWPAGPGRRWWSLSVVEASPARSSSVIDLSEIGGRKTACPNAAPFPAAQVRDRRRSAARGTAGGRRLVADPAAGCGR
jgi:squalene-hopene/tetraprenyl-beta-curcumene cyclase